jgi:hypothetical protein
VKNIVQTTAKEEQTTEKEEQTTPLISKPIENL